MIFFKLDFEAGRVKVGFPKGAPDGAPALKESYNERLRRNKVVMSDKKLLAVSR